MSPTDLPSTPDTSPASDSDLAKEAEGWDWDKTKSALGWVGIAVGAVAVVAVVVAAAPVAATTAAVAGTVAAVATVIGVVAAAGSVAIGLAQGNTWEEIYDGLGGLVGLIGLIPGMGKLAAVILALISLLFGILGKVMTGASSPPSDGDPSNSEEETKQKKQALDPKEPQIIDLDPVIITVPKPNTPDTPTVIILDPIEIIIKIPPDTPKPPQPNKDKKIPVKGETPAPNINQREYSRSKPAVVRLPAVTAKTKAGI